MKKLTLLTAALISSAAVASMPLTAEATGRYPGLQMSSNKNVIVIRGNNSSCDLQSVIQNLKNCFPNLNIPDFSIPDQPDNNLPDQDVPDNQPDQDVPDNDIPDQDVPDNDIPDQDVPDNDIPDQDVPDNDIPDQDVPDNNNPDRNEPDTEQPGDTEELTYAEQVVKLVNEERAKQGLSALSIKEDVRAAAQVRAVEIQTSFSHTRPDGSKFSTALTQQNVSFRGAGENIAWGQKSPEEVMTAWMNSDGHRANILNKNFTSMGVGYAEKNGLKYWTQLFTY